jgi:hypothetical protein
MGDDESAPNKAKTMPGTPGNKSEKEANQNQQTAQCDHSDGDSNSFGRVCQRLCMVSETFTRWISRELAVRTRLNLVTTNQITLSALRANRSGILRDRESHAFALQAAIRTLRNVHFAEDVQPAKNPEQGSSTANGTSDVLHSRRLA